MAGGLQNTSSVGSHEFNKDLNKDIGNIYVPNNVWGHARNAINNSKTGDLGKVGNEPANDLCTEAPYQVIGMVHLVADTWTCFSTNGIQSEIGLFYADTCKYVIAVNANCLAFSAYNLIKGTSRATANCVYEVYWDDGLNNSRYITLNIEDPAVVNPFTNPDSPIPWIQILNPLNVPPCMDMINTPALNCDKIRVAKLINTPCVEVKKGIGGGTLLNGSYLVYIAYAISGQKISDWYMSNVQPLFEHDNSACSLDVEILSMDTRYSEIIVLVGSIINQQTVVRQAGIYSTHQTRLSFDVIQNDWPAVPIEQLPIMTPIPDKSDAMYNVGPYLIRVGPTSKLDFNYQPLANQIVTKWVSVEYPADYYRKGGNHTNYLRDEVYSFFIRYVYDTGDRSASYHIPGRPGSTALGEVFPNGTATPAAGADVIPGYDTFFFQTLNTANQTAAASPALPDGGVPIAEGVMSYWQSTESYPDDKPEIWDTNIAAFPVSPYNGLGTLGVIPGTAQNLCGKKIRHHRFPEERNGIGGTSNLFNTGVGDRIRIMGVKFENILAPVINPQDPRASWQFVPGIVGYEILRGTRNGNKTIIAKGIINNMGQYAIEGGSSKTGLYPNYPYNDLTADPFLTTQPTRWVPSSGLLAGVTGSGGNGAEVITSGGTLQQTFSRDNFTFHSPDTNFSNPFLSAKELKIYGNIKGNVVGKFDISEKHPKEKLITDFGFLISAIVGIGLAGLAMNGQRRVNRLAPHSPGYSQNGFSYPSVSGTTTGTWLPYGAGTLTGSITTAGTPMVAPNNGAQPKTADVATIGTAATAVNTGYTSYKTLVDSGVIQFQNLMGVPSGGTFDTSFTALNTAYNTASNTTKAMTTSPSNVENDDGAMQRTPGVVRFISSIPMFLHYFTEGSDTTIRLIKSIMRFRDFALRYHSHGFYNTYIASNGGNRRRAITNEQYLGPQIADFGTNLRINNLYRSRTVAVQVGAVITDPQPDRTRYKATSVPGLLENDVFGQSQLKDPTKIEFSTGTAGLGGGDQIASSHYAALKQRIDNQYGQLTNIIQVPVSTCTIQAFTLDAQGIPLVSKTGVLFGGDTYVGRYTEKNTFFYFYEWLYNQPDGGQLDYQSHRMLPHPRFWANFNEFETSDFTTTALPAVTAWNSAILKLPSSYYNLDRVTGSQNFTWTAAPLSAGFNVTPSLNAMRRTKLSVQDSWFYLFNSGVRDFFVESEINIDLRDYGNGDSEVHYDAYRYSDTKALFDTAIIKAGNYYKYDSSLSYSRLFINYTSWANMQSREYSPFLAETCFTYRPRRVIYSLPAQFEGRRDNWLIFLANNYYDFLNRVTCMKPVNKNGAIIFFDSASPVQFQGTDQLQTGLGTKLTIGDGGLFSQPLQALVNADAPYEYASCQDRLSVINTPAGIFWMSQNQGKIFRLGNAPDPISDKDLKWWFNQYLPYKLTQLFPAFTLTDNPVVGIGCQAVYDNENGLAYFCKKDYILKAGYTPNLTPAGLPAVGPGNIQYNGKDNFIYVPTGLNIKLGNPAYFEPASWTVSYDPKVGGWLGWHDWHPELLIPGKNTFISIVTSAAKKGGFWVHNERCDLYCNYYGVNYPFEIEYMVNTPTQITTLRSIEYFMEVYKYDPNCYDRFHVLDYNFDEVVIYNTEQCSGMLRMTPSPKNNPQLLIQYPLINPTFIEILFSKEENKYRFNQFWDITDDRGEYPAYPAPPVAQRMIWNTGANGYIKLLNPINLNYNKSEFQRKKFRHYTNSVFLRKRVIANQNMTYKILVMITENKQLNSPR